MAQDVSTTAAVRAGRQHGLPGLRAVPAHERRRQRRLRPDDPQGARRRSRPPGRRRPADGPPRGLRQRKPCTAVGRPAPARRARPGARQPAPGAAPRRAARRARPQAAPGDAARAQGDPAPGRHHVHLRHPRPGRGAHHERPDRDLHRGRIEQVGTPAEVYERPATAFVAGFVGTSNVLDRRGGASRSSDGSARSPCGPRRSTWPTRASPSAGRSSADGHVRDVVYLGSDTRYTWRSMPAASSWSSRRT